MTMVFWVILFVILIALFLKFYLFAGNKEPVIHKGDWKKDVVYLYQFKRPVHLPNLSPFCMKIELFMKANKIDYEVVESNFTRSYKGLLPFIELNGEQIADSEFIIYKLAEKFNAKENLPKEKAGTLRALSRMFDEEVFRLNMYFKIQSEEFAGYMVSGILPSYLSQYLFPVLYTIIKFMISRRLKGAGYGAHNEGELKALYQRDLQAANDILGNDKFFGGEKITMADCTVYGQLASIYLVPRETVAHGMIRKDFPNLVKYMDNVSAQYFSEFPCGKNQKQ